MAYPQSIEPEADAPLDTAVCLVTPERVRFLYPLAGPFRRSLAYLIDAIVLLGLATAGTYLASLVSLGSESGRGLSLAILFALIWGYGAVLEGTFNGQTVGKRALGLRVMTTQGVPITGSQATVRNLLGTVDGPFPFLYLPGLTAMFLTAKFQRLGDLAAGTMVVVEERRHGGSVPRVDEASLGGLPPLLPLRVSAGPDLARALSDYVRHRPRFNRERREEIARHLAGPIRDRFQLPASASSDAVLCAFYHRLFLGE